MRSQAWTILTRIVGESMQLRTNSVAFWRWKRSVWIASSVDFKTKTVSPVFLLREERCCSVIVMSCRMLSAALLYVCLYGGWWYRIRMTQRRYPYEALPSGHHLRKKNGICCSRLYNDAAVFCWDMYVCAYGSYQNSLVVQMPSSNIIKAGTEAHSSHTQFFFCAAFPALCANNTRQ